MTTAQEIARHTSQHAYMAYAYSEAAYHRVACFLLREGFTPEETQRIMNSKHMRWAVDAGDGEATSGTFKRYYGVMEPSIRADIRRWENA